MPLLIIGIAGFAWWFLTRDATSTEEEDNSAKEDMRESKDYSLIDPDFAWLIDEMGQLYDWGENDCSEWLLRVSRAHGILPSDWPDMNTLAIANACDKVETGNQQPGDFAYYPGHVMFVAGYPNPSEDNHSPVVGMSGGGRETNGDDPNACVKLFARGDYRTDFVCYMRVKPL